jgi:hypothetical protein
LGLSSSPDEAKRNPGTIDKASMQLSDFTAFIRATKKETKEIKEAERRKTLFRNHRSLAG